MSSRLECAVEKELLIRIKAAGGLCEKVTVIGTRGFFDRLVLLPQGRVVFVECKRPRGGRVSPHQRERHLRYRQLGAEIVMVKNSEDIDTLLTSG